MKRSLLFFKLPSRWRRNCTMLVLLVLTTALQAHINPNHHHDRLGQSASDQVSFRENCDNAVAQIDQQINNVRARLTTGGDVWWNGSEGRYIVPKPPPGQPEVSAIFAAGVWLGGRDPGGNLKIAAQTYGRSSGNFDYYPGPLQPGAENYPGGPLADPRRGNTGRDTCAQWDKFFTVSGANIDAHMRAWRQARAQGETSLDPESISDDILGWPARGNRFFAAIHQFRLPETTQGLAGFWDQDADGLYEPDEGDYPIVEIRSCFGAEPLSNPDEIIFWVYNDAGNDHRETGSPNKMQMEIQVQAFAYQTNDDLNNMTFQRYKLINRAIEQLDSTYFGMWVDPDLGCYTDDYIGCDVDRSLAYIYNADQLDGTNGCVCDQGINTYCDEIPILGIDYFRGPLNEWGEELGMSSFTYYNNGGVIGVPNGMSDPNTPQEYYNYLSGRWRDGTPLTFGGDGYQEDGPITHYAFVDPPNDPDGWSMCAEGLPVGDRRTIQASGPFRLYPGAVNELIVGVVWVPDQLYPCPRLDRLWKADDRAQDLIDNCIHIPIGPDAPNVDWVELDREIIAIFSNDPFSSNNAFEGYQEQGLSIPSGQDSMYRFEGYKLFQFAGPEVSLADQDDPEKVRLVYQVDKRNGVAKIFNWEALSPNDNEIPTAEPFLVPVLKVDGANEGIRHTFRITEDQFAEGDRRLVNHRKYYFAAVAYAHNNYLEFDQNRQSEDPGQDTPYRESDRNIGDGENGHYRVIPRTILDREVRSRYGEGPIITRIDGIGNGANFLDLSAATREEIEALIREDNAAAFSGEVTYQSGFGPINVQIYNPLEVVDGEYELTFVDDHLDNAMLDAPTTWVLRSLTNPSAPVITAEASIAEQKEQIIGEFGFSVTVAQIPDAGTLPFEVTANGARGYEEAYRNPDALPWLFGIRDNLPIQTGNPVFDAAIYDFMATTNSTDLDFALDPNQAYSKLGNGFLVPYYLANWRDQESGVPYLTPAWVSSGNSNNIVRNQTSLETLNNVDIVFTNDKSLWSRCVIVETMNPAYEEAGYFAVGGRKMFDLRAHPSVSKEAGADGLPMPDTHPPAGEEEGMGWFPGYAVDVETGQRLNIFFGENSVYDCDNLAQLGLDSACSSLTAVTDSGGDMMFNPHSEFFLPTATATGGVTPFNYVSGGQHFIYVTNQPYDRCEELRERLGDVNPLRKVAVLRDLIWCGMIVLPPGRQLLSYANGLIPEDVIVKLRVDNAYQVAEGTGELNGYPTYLFRFGGKQAADLNEIGLADALQAIHVIPNPYYGFSEYEDNQFENIVKISNLPAKCTVTIYSLAGKFIRQYERDEVGAVPRGTNRAIDRGQITPDLEWDLKNFRQIPIASGVYLIHVAAPGLGERTLKWFGVNRQFDPSGL